MTTTPEWKLQHAIVKRLRALQAAGCNFEFAGDQNAAVRGPKAATIAKATGMQAGEPDLRLYLPNGKLRMIEVKAANGRLSDAQITRHASLRALGFQIAVLQASNEIDAANDAEQLVLAWLGKRPVAANDNVPVAKRQAA